MTEHLTSKEKEIMNLVTVENLSNSQIAVKLNISRSNVTYTKSNICRKLKINRVAEWKN